ncbi:AraC family transcriptional regulator [Streptococcus orisasini]|uniref:AraC family transcriptional regulator n=1 Tax=Streptococcus orisasini TaxID=1080071 RepID=UPI000709A65C|nr:AraC family transcriptional regulator [Streptococcus orisasini]
MKDFLTDENFKHITNFDNHLLPYKIFKTEIANGWPDTLFHWHPELEISYIYEGTAQYHIDYDYFNSQSGDIILVRPNGMHSIHPIDDKTQKAETLLFHLDMVGYSLLDQTSLRYLQPLQNSSFKLVPCIKQGMSGYDAIKSCLFAIFDIYHRQGRHFELLLKAKLQELLYLLYFHQYVLYKHSNDMYRKNEKIRELIDYIHQHYQEELSIECLAKFIGYSKTHFMTVFKQHTGISCTEFIIQFRLSKACDLLVNSIKPILEISTEVGFNNLSNFNRQFKRYYRMTPSHYRKTIKKTN